MQQSMRSVLTMALLLLLVVGAQAMAEGTMVFRSDSTGVWHVYTANLDGSNIKALTEGSAETRHPRISPNGERIVFVSHLDGTWKIYTMDVDGGDLQPVVAADAASYPTWSPDGTQIAFNKGGQIHVIGTDGTGLRQVTSVSGTHRQVSWSPDGEWLAFSSTRGGNYELYMIRVDGTEERRLTFDGGHARFPDWSPDGTQIVFDSNVGGNYDIYLLDVATLKVTQLTDHPRNDLFPTWAPDGSTIVFTSVRGFNVLESVYIMNPDGSDVRVLVESPGNKNEYASWASR